MTYPALPDIKARLGITTANHDAALSAALSAARGAVENYCGYRWEYPDSETRIFDVSYVGKDASGLCCSQFYMRVGLLSYTELIGVRRRPRTRVNLSADDVVSRRLSTTGEGAYDFLMVYGRYAELEVTGVFGRGLIAPPEVSEAVMLLALQLFAEGTGLGVSVDVTVETAAFERATIDYLLAGHRRYR